MTARATHDHGSRLGELLLMLVAFLIAIGLYYASLLFP